MTLCWGEVTFECRFFLKIEEKLCQITFDIQLNDLFQSWFYINTVIEYSWIGADKIFPINNPMLFGYRVENFDFKYIYQLLILA